MAPATRGGRGGRWPLLRISAGAPRGFRGEMCLVDDAQASALYSPAGDTAWRMASTGASRPVHSSRLRAPWRTSTSRPPTTRPSPRDAQRHERRGLVSVHEVHHGRGRRDAGQLERRQRLVLVAVRHEPDRGRVHEQVGRAGQLRVAHAELGRQRRGASGRAVPDRHVRARLAQRPDGGPAGAAGPEHERAPARHGLAPGRAISPPASVLSALMRPSAKRQRVGRADRRRRVGSARRPASRAASLCGIVTFAPT